MQEVKRPGTLRPADCNVPVQQAPAAAKISTQAQPPGSRVPPFRWHGSRLSRIGVDPRASTAIDSLCCGSGANVADAEDKKRRPAVRQHERAA